jgi:hypothetical protein
MGHDMPAAGGEGQLQNHIIVGIGKERPPTMLQWRARRWYPLAMSPIAQELDSKLHAMDPETARLVEHLVRDALLRAAEKTGGNGQGKDLWPPHYFTNTAGALAGEQFERPPQGQAESRESW